MVAMYVLHQDVNNEVNYYYCKAFRREASVVRVQKVVHKGLLWLHVCRFCTHLVILILQAMDYRGAVGRTRPSVSQGYF